MIKIKESYKSGFSIAFIFLFLMPLYFLKLGSLPASIHGDEAETALQAINIIRSHFVLIGVGWYDLPLVSFLPHSLFMFFFGENIASDRLGSAVFGFLSLPIFYFLLKDILNKKIALIAAILLGTSHLWIALSRLGITYVQSTFFVIFLSFTLFKSLETNKKIYFGISGVIFGLSMYSNFTVRLLPILTILFFINYFLKKGDFKTKLLNLLLFLTLSFLVFLPQGIFYFNNSETFLSREKSIFVFSKEAKESSEYTQMNNLEILIEQTKRTFDVFEGENSGQYGYKGQLLDNFSIILFLFGISYCLIRIKDFTYLFLLVWLALSIAGQIFSSIPPPIFLPRFVVGLPVLYLFITFGLIFLLDILKNTLKIKKTHEYLLIAFIVIIFSYFNVLIYFVNNPKEVLGDPNARAATKISAILNKGFTTAYFATPYVYADFSTLNFLAPKVTKIDLNSSSPKALKTPNSIYIIFPSYQNIIPFLFKQIPGDKLKEVRDVDGTIQFYIFN